MRIHETIPHATPSPDVLILNAAEPESSPHARTMFRLLDTLFELEQADDTEPRAVSE